MVRLLGEVAALSGGLTDKKRYLIDGLCELIDVDCWLWTPIAPVKSGEPVVGAIALHSGFSESRFAAYLSATEHPDMARFNAIFIEEIQSRKAHTTRLRQQLDPEDDFVRSDVYPLWEAANIAPILLSCYPFVDGSFSLVALYRDKDKALFSKRDARIAHILLSEVPWLHAHALPLEKRFQELILAPRERTTLNLLMQGLGRQQIASHMGISENTLSGYIKRIYRLYNVQAHSELMHYFRAGDGGDG